MNSGIFGDSASANWGIGGKATGGLFDVFEQLRTVFDPKPASRVGKGDVRTAVLAVLADAPMHGYQIIQEIEERSGGAWKPSPGSVYPTLQLLADEGLIQAEESGGRKTYSLTAEGREVADASAEQVSWKGAPAKSGAAAMTALPKAGMELAQAAAQVGRTGSQEQIEEAVAILDDARRAIYAILARG